MLIVFVKLNYRLKHAGRQLSSLKGINCIIDTAASEQLKRYPVQQIQGGNVQFHL